MSGRSLARPIACLVLAACCAQAAAQSAAKPVDQPAAAQAEKPVPAGSATAPAPAAQPLPAQSAIVPSAPLTATPAADTPATTIPRREPLVTPIPGGAGPSAGNLLQTIFGLCVVLALLAGLAWFLKRFGPKNATGSADLRIVGALNLGGRERIVVVEVGDQWIVVGASPGRINALATIPRQQEGIGGVPVVPGAYAPSATSFSEWLKQTIDKRK